MGLVAAGRGRSHPFSALFESDRMAAVIHPRAPLCSRRVFRTTSRKAIGLCYLDITKTHFVTFISNEKKVFSLLGHGGIPIITYSLYKSSLCYNLHMRLPSLRMGLALIPGAIVLGLSGLAVAAQSGLFTGTLETEAREYAMVVWGVAGALIVSSLTIIILNIIKRRKTINRKFQRP